MDRSAMMTTGWSMTGFLTKPQPPVRLRDDNCEKNKDKANMARGLLEAIAEHSVSSGGNRG